MIYFKRKSSIESDPIFTTELHNIHESQGRALTVLVMGKMQKLIVM